MSGCGSIRMAFSSSRDRSSSCSIRVAEADGLLPQRVLELLAGLGCELVSLVLERRRDPVDRSRRRAQLVRRDRDEVELHLVEPDELVMESSPPRSRSRLARRRAAAAPGRRQSKKRGVSVPTWMHADHSVGRDQRHSEHALDALFVEDRVQDVRVVDIVEHDRACLGRDPACEAAADRDAHALLRPPLRARRPPWRRARSSPRRASAPRPCRPARMLLEPHEQLAHELVEAKVCERRVHHGLNLFEPRPATALGVEQASVLDRDAPRGRRRPRAARRRLS